jgi:hypothetical protein
MTWQNPWAWLGLLALAAPILIHLLARRSARVQRFPTLRFLEATRLLPARSTRLSDLPLLLVRLAIVAVAVAALAQPLLRTANRQRNLGRTLARAILVDTSASMLQLMPTGESGSAYARREAARLAGEAQAGVVVETSDPARQIAGASSWLGKRAARRELVVISDFRLGAIDPADFTAVPAEMGIRLLRVDTRSDSAPVDVITRSGAIETIARVTIQPRSTDVQWSARAPSVETPDIQLLSSAAEQATAEAAKEAVARVAAVTQVDPARSSAIVYPGYEQRALVLSSTQPLNQPWMGDVVAALRNHGSLERAARGNVNGRERLLLFTSAGPASIESATLMLSALEALDVAPPAHEHEPDVLPDRVLQELQREPATLVAPARPPDRKTARPQDRKTRNLEDDGVSDGRWLWLLVWALLALETWMRRARRETRALPESPAAYERVA